MRVAQKMWLLIGLLVLFAFALEFLHAFVLVRHDNFNGNEHSSFDDFRMVVRSVKYGMLFIVLTFGTFFLFEVLQGLRIHPMQYLLVGIALVLFYLMLLSFAEKMAFIWAYLIAAVASLSLITWYVQFVLQQAKNSWALSALLVISYAVMLFLLHSQTHTLVIGSTLLFCVLAIVMYLTRHVDWYALHESTTEREIDEV